LPGLSQWACRITGFRGARGFQRSYGQVCPRRLSQPRKGITRGKLTKSTIAVWLVPITIQVFAAETAVRGLRNPGFPPRGKRSVPICLVAVVMLIILTWIPSRAYPAGDSCIASLTFYIRNKGRAGVVTISCITVVIVASLAIITIQLSRNAKIPKSERIAASRMVYYLVITTIIMVRSKNVSAPNKHTVGLKLLIGLCFSILCGEDQEPKFRRRKYDGHNSIKYMGSYQ
jgi:hypothetical protein